MKKVILLLLVIMICFPVIAEAESDFGTDLKVDMFDTAVILENIDDMSNILITTIRVGVLIILTPLVISIGITLFTAKDSYALEQVKGRSIFLLIGLLLIFTTEPIVRFIYSLIK